MSKKLGIIGGLGPLATAYYYELVTNMTQVGRDQDHIEIFIHSVPQTPDRTGYIIGESQENPLPVLIETGRRLVSQGAECIAIPCITAHYFYQDLIREIPVPIIHLVEETTKYIQKQGIQRVGIMATDGTIKSALFQQALKSCGMEALVPENTCQSDVMHLIYNNIKVGLPPEMERFARVASHLKERGAEVIVLGCTELSLIKRDQSIGSGFLDTLDVLAQKAVKLCEAKIKPEYKELITT